MEPMMVPEVCGRWSIVAGKVRNGGNEDIWERIDRTFQLVDFTTSETLSWKKTRFPLPDMLEAHKGYGGIGTFLVMKVPPESANQFGELVVDSVTNELLHFTEEPETFVHLSCKVDVELTDPSRTIKATLFDKCATRLLRTSPEDLHKKDKQATTKLLLDIDEQLDSKKLIMEIKVNKKNFNDKITRYTVLDWTEKDQATDSINEGQMSSQTTVDSGVTTVSGKGRRPKEMESTTQGSDTEHNDSSNSSTPQKKKPKTSSKAAHCSHVSKEEYKSILQTCPVLLSFDSFGTCNTLSTV